MPKSQTAILMATYNGEKYLGEQMVSLLSQNDQDWHLYVHDDGSQDSTVQIVEYYAANHPEKITLLNYPPQGGACKNFLSILEHVEADYYLFCDQDDIWLPDKIEVERAQMKQLEENNPNTPIVVFSDLEVVDSNMNIINTSMWNAIGIYPELVCDFSSGGVHEYVTGCTMLFNRKARNEALQHDAQKALMHDSWLTLCVLKAGGVASGIRKPLIRYRQHAANTLGASDKKRRTWRYKMCNIYYIFKHDKSYWQMLRSLGYGSYLKFVYYKYIYRHFKHTDEQH